MNARQRSNLLKLAAYLESLPKNYSHFDMGWFADHEGDCELPMDAEVYAAKNPSEFLNNCGTVACAVGHGPAAGIKVADEEFICRGQGVNWHGYSRRAFGVGATSRFDAFSFLFGAQWDLIDNHHYGAAARIRYYLATGDYDSDAGDHAIKRYAPYRKGSRSAVRRELEAA